MAASAGNAGEALRFSPPPYSFLRRFVGTLSHTSDVYLARDGESACTYNAEPYGFCLIDKGDRRLLVSLMQFGRRVGDRIDSLLKQALETNHPAPTVLSALQLAISEYRIAKASGWRLSGRRCDDLTGVQVALSATTIGPLENARRSPLETIRI